MLYPTSTGPESRRSAVGILAFLVGFWFGLFGLFFYAFGEGTIGLVLGSIWLQLWVAGWRLNRAQPGRRRR